jgi:hypothetical protein
MPGLFEYVDNNGQQETYMKSFLDYFLLTYSKCIYLVVDGQMYKSNFPLTAALYNNVSFLVIE